MPITQDRMIAVLREGEDARSALLDLRTTISDILARNEAGAACSVIRLLLTVREVPSDEALRRERAHFERARARNEQNKIAMRNKRKGSGI